MTVALWGHRDASPEVESEVRRVLVDLIEHDGACLFYVGNEGNFDRIAQRVLSRLSKEYIHIRCYIVLAYLPKNQFLESFSLKTIYPEGLECVPQRFAICKRNEWILSRADTLVMHVPFSVGNSYRLKLKAERKGKKVINIL